MVQVGTEFGIGLLWRNKDGAYLVWKLDDDGNWASTTDLVNANVEAIVNYEVLFSTDLNNDGTIGHFVTDIDTTGIGLQSSTRGVYQFVDGGDALDLSFQGSPAGPQSFAGWQALAAGANGAAAYNVLWQHAAGNYTSGTSMLRVPILAPPR